ncbi:hypothetical protein N7492_009850 [Penicillium capsulatum]|uniref:Uncharacterized protein n=1 Tax=Penicillium capsulatum TaxID=69766 RepID=A0A9W9HMW2_9EURO|nr:hypothetical protein N7492_009850 [Penicillium capsulatum]KAJ6112361.1 hypothetical protein N7512_007685 [Penicillium capsulatum]
MLFSLLPLPYVAIWVSILLSGSLGGSWPLVCTGPDEASCVTTDIWQMSSEMTRNAISTSVNSKSLTLSLPKSPGTSTPSTPSTGLSSTPSTTQLTPSTAPVPSDPTPYSTAEPTSSGRPTSSSGTMRSTGISPPVEISRLGASPTPSDYAGCLMELSQCMAKAPASTGKPTISSNTTPGTASSAEQSTGPVASPTRSEPSQGSSSVPPSSGDPVGISSGGGFKTTPSAATWSSPAAGTSVASAPTASAMAGDVFADLQWLYLETMQPNSPGLEGNQVVQKKQWAVRENFSHEPWNGCEDHLKMFDDDGKVDSLSLGQINTHAAPNNGCVYQGFQEGPGVLRCPGYKAVSCYYPKWAKDGSSSDCAVDNVRVKVHYKASCLFKESDRLQA